MGLTLDTDAPDGPICASDLTSATTEVVGPVLSVDEGDPAEDLSAAPQDASAKVSITLARNDLIVPSCPRTTRSARQHRPRRRDRRKCTVAVQPQGLIARLIGRSQPGAPVGFAAGHRPGPISRIP